MKDWIRKEDFFPLLMVCILCLIVYFFSSLEEEKEEIEETITSQERDRFGHRLDSRVVYDGYNYRRVTNE